MSLRAILENTEKHHQMDILILIHFKTSGKILCTADGILHWSSHLEDQDRCTFLILYHPTPRKSPESANSLVYYMCVRQVSSALLIFTTNLDIRY